MRDVVPDTTVQTGSPCPLLQDRERGVVWEETIIFLPRETRMVFLSATLSNAAEFASWVAALHAQVAVVGLGPVNAL